MTKYVLTAPVYMDGWCVVEIDNADDEGNPLSPEELLDRGIDNANMPSLCHQCAGWKRTEGFEESGDADWDKATIRLKEARDDY